MSLQLFLTKHLKVCPSNHILKYPTTNPKQNRILTCKWSSNASIPRSLIDEHLSDNEWICLDASGNECTTSSASSSWAPIKLKAWKPLLISELYSFTRSGFGNCRNSRHCSVGISPDQYLGQRYKRSRHFIHTWAKMHLSYGLKYIKNLLIKRSSRNSWSTVREVGGITFLLWSCCFWSCCCNIWWWILNGFGNCLRICWGVLVWLDGVVVVIVWDGGCCWSCCCWTPPLLFLLGFSGVRVLLFADWILLEFELPLPPHNAFVTRSITEVLLGLEACGVDADDDDDDVEELLLLAWWCFDRNPSPLIRFESSAEALSTTPWADDIDDIFRYNSTLNLDSLPDFTSQNLVYVLLYNLTTLFSLHSPWFIYMVSVSCCP